MSVKASSTQPLAHVRVLVTGVGSSGVGLGILQAAIKAGYETYATDITPYSIGLLRARKGFVVPYANEPDYLRSIRKICKRNAIRVVVPGSEPELFRLSLEQPRLQREGILLIANDHEIIRACRDKWLLFHEFRKKGVPCPDSALPAKYSEFRKKHGFPMLLKQRTGTGSRNLFVLKDNADYVLCAKRLVKEQIPFLLQEYVGTSSEEYTVGVVCRKDGSVIGSIAVHRLLEGLSIQQKVKAGQRMVAISTGISQGIVEENNEIQEQCERYATRLGITGPANFQGRMINGLFVVFELNARFSGTTPFRVEVGFNDVDLVIRDRLGERVAKPHFRTGVVVLRSFENFFTSLDEIRRFRAP